MKHSDLRDRPGLTYEMKAKARKALMGHWPTALLVALIATLPSLLMQVSVTLAEQQFLREHPSLLTAPTIGDLMALAQAYQLPFLAGMGLVLLTEFLNLGMKNYMLRILRGEFSSVRTVLSRGRYAFKAIGLMLALALKMLLWMLPLMAAVVATAVFARHLPMQVIRAVLSLAPLASGVLTVWLVLRYFMCDFLLADEPDMGVFQCIRESVAMMKGRKTALVVLQLSFFGWTFLQMMVQTLLTSLFGGVIGMTLGMTANMFLQVYIQTTVCAYYLDCRQCGNYTAENAA